MTKGAVAFATAPAVFTGTSLPRRIAADHDPGRAARFIDHIDVPAVELDQFVPGVIAVLFGVVLMGLYYIARERAR